MDYFIDEPDNSKRFIDSMYNELYGNNKTSLITACCTRGVTLETINEYKDEIGKTDSFNTTALIYYCLYDGSSSEIINALSSEIGMQDTEGYTALMGLMTDEHETIDIDCVLALRNEIGMKNHCNEYALDMFCTNIYRKLNKDLANQIVNILRDEYVPNRYYNGVDIESIIN